MKGLEFILLGVGSALGAFLRYKLTECDLVLNEELTVGLIKKLRDHFEEKHGLDYTIEAVTQMITNRGHSLESIKK